jgi:hypothetical protein
MAAVIEGAPPRHLRFEDAFRDALDSMRGGAWPVMVLGPVAAGEVFAYDGLGAAAVDLGLPPELWRPLVVVFNMSLNAGGCSMVLATLRGEAAAPERLLDGFRHGGRVAVVMGLLLWPAVAALLFSFGWFTFLRSIVPGLGTDQPTRQLWTAMMWGAIVLVYLAALFAVPRFPIALCASVSPEIPVRGVRRLTADILRGNQLRVTLLFSLLGAAAGLASMFLPVALIVAQPAYVLVAAAVFHQLMVWPPPLDPVEVD